MLELAAERRPDLVDADRARDAQHASALLDDGGHLGGLFLNLARYLVEDILECDDARRAAVLVEDHRHL